MLRPVPEEKHHRPLRETPGVVSRWEKRTHECYQARILVALWGLLLGFGRIKEHRD